MDKIVEIMDDISGNVDEAFEKAEKAYRMKELCPHYADWQMGMATSHLSFNSRGMDELERMLDESKGRGEHMKLDDPFANFCRTWKARIAQKTAKVKSMIEAFPK